MEALGPNGTSPTRIFIFDSLRIRSHLFFRWLSTCPELGPVYHPYLMTAYLGQERWNRNARGSEKRKHENEVDLLPIYGDDTIESCTQDLERAVGEVEAKDKIFLANEHWFNVTKYDTIYSMVRDKAYSPSDLPSNPTSIPDWLFYTISPVILIRDPLLSIPSVYASLLEITQMRPGDEEFEVVTSLEYPRALFEFFKNQGKRPIVVNAEDILWRTDDLGKSIAAALGFGSDELSDRWKPTPEDQKPKNPVLCSWTTTIHSSSGIVRPAEKPDDPELETEFGKWTKKYGAEVAAQLKRFVEANIPHYEYMIQFKV